MLSHCQVILEFTPHEAAKLKSLHLPYLPFSAITQPSPGTAGTCCFSTSDCPYREERVVRHFCCSPPSSLDKALSKYLTTVQNRKTLEEQINRKKKGGRPGRHTATLSKSHQGIAELQSGAAFVGSRPQQILEFYILLLQSPSLNPGTFIIPHRAKKEKRRSRRCGGQGPRSFGFDRICFLTKA